MRARCLFLAGWCGGLRDWWAANPGMRMMPMHKPFAIDTNTANQWAEAMERAIDDADLDDAEIAETMRDVQGQMARDMPPG